MIARGLSVLGVAVALALPGCAVERSDFDALREQVRLQQRQISDLKARQDEQGLRVETMNNGFKILVDKVDENSRRIDEAAERGSLSARPAAAPTAVAPAPIPSPAPSPSPAPAPAAPAPSAPPPSEDPILLTNKPRSGAAQPAGVEIITAGPKAEKLYAGALQMYSNRDYNQAAAKFQEFVGSFPDHALAGNAQYWIGECLYSQKRFDEAADAFGKVEQVYPASRKVPAALLKKGLSLTELKRIPDAQAALQRLVDKYAQTEEAAKAKERLAHLKQQ